MLSKQAQFTSRDMSYIVARSSYIYLSNPSLALVDVAGKYGTPLDCVKTNNGDH